MVTLFEHLTREDAETFSLVLNAVGIGHRVTGTTSRYCIDVPEPLTEAALTAIHRYQAENAVPLTEPIPARHRPAPLPLSGIFVALILLTVYLAIEGSQAPQDYDKVFGADARRIMGGDIYRCATALLLHADATHIVANMVGIALFGGAVCAITGAGVGWFMILASGILGNLINAWAYQQDHLSVGASTAIFGAIGMLCGIQGLAAIRTGKGWKQVGLIAGAGIALLAFLGTGIRSDIGAHLFGWLAGVLFGVIHGVFFNSPLGKKWQITAAAIAMLSLVAAWIRGAIG